MQNPQEDHQCTPTCSLCGEAHATGDKRCKKRFQVPYIVWQSRRQRSWEQCQQRDPGDQVFRGETKQRRDRSETPHSNRRRSSRRCTPARAPQLAPQLRPGHRAAAAPCGGGAPSEEPPQPRDAANRPRAALVRRGHLSGRPRGRTRPGTTGPGPTEQWIRAGKPPRDREENQVTHAALAEHQQHKSKA